MGIERWISLIFRGARLWKKQGVIELARRVRQKISRKIKFSVERLRWRFGRHVAGVYLRAPLQKHQAAVEVIVCVHNALPDVQRCLESVLQHTSLPYSLILVDDGSDAIARNYLVDFAIAHRAVLLRNEQARGYTRAANQGLRHSTTDFVVLLNSDTIVTDEWLDRLIACAESNPRIGLVGPLSNTASWQSVPEIEAQGDWAENPLPADVTIDEMGRLIARYSARLYPRVPLLNGFCIMIRRAVIKAIGYFDEEDFGPGYGEEDDYVLRARKARWLSALADDTYIYHAQSRSYSTEKRKELSRQAGARLAKKHGEQIIGSGISFWRSDRLLEGIRARSRVMFARQQWIKRGKAEFAGRRVLFVLPLAEPSGGGNVVIREAMAMREMGVDARIFNLDTNREAFEQGYPEREIPVLYGTRQDLVTAADSNDALVATANFSVEWLAPVTLKNGCKARGYYVQDFEPYLHAPGSADFQKAWASYSLFPGLVRFTKTEWTRQEVEKQIGVPCELVGVSLDIDLFRPRLRSSEWPDRPLKVAAMVRPSTPYREPRLTMELLQRASKQYADVDPVIFGTTLDDSRFYQLPFDFPWRLVGVLNQKQVAQLLNEVDIFVDFSSHQAMGLTALEAMACGAAVIVPKRGGAVSFARDGENSLVVDTSSSEECWRALQRLIEDHALRARLQRNAIVDVCNFYPELPAYNILNTLFNRERIPEQ